MDIVAIESLKGISGIYQIQCIASGKVYVGSSINIGKRLIAHRVCLRQGKHHAQGLQNAWNKYGKSGFTVSLVEAVPPVKAKLVEREQFWIDKLEAYTVGYNASPKAGSRLGSKASLETREKQSNLHRGKTKRGKKAATIDNIDAIEYEFVSPDGILYRGRNVSAFAREHGLPKSALLNLMHKRNDLLSYKGWRLPNPRENKLEKAQRYYIFISPDGVVHQGRNVKKFAEEHGLRPNCMRALLDGRRISYRGWKTLEKFGQEPKHPNIKPYAFISPTGQIYAGVNVYEFAKKHKLDGAALHRVLKGEALQHKGWRKATEVKARKQSNPDYQQLSLELWID